MFVAVRAQPVVIGLSTNVAHTIAGIWSWRLSSRQFPHLLPLVRCLWLWRDRRMRVFIRSSIFVRRDIGIGPEHFETGFGSQGR